MEGVHGVAEKFMGTRKIFWSLERADRVTAPRIRERTGEKGWQHFQEEDLRGRQSNSRMGGGGTCNGPIAQENFDWKMVFLSKRALRSLREGGLEVSIKKKSKIGGRV